MEQIRRRLSARANATPELDELQQNLVALYDDLTETTAWTALVCDGICGILAEHPVDVDPSAQTGMRFAAIWLKRRNQEHAIALQTACDRLRELRELRKPVRQAGRS